jgi:tetratricopeptide (TPR) repeat protein
MLETGTESLEAALAAYHEVLAEFSRGKNPASWAQTQKNIGVAHILLATRRKGEGDFDKSIAAFNLALAEFRKSGDRFGISQVEQALKMAEQMRDLMKQMEGAQ